jgi:AcrR family transcriptional regulator
MMARPYSSLRRSHGADETRRAILDAALALFTERGYTTTTIADVARAATVASNTVYVSIGGKPRVVLALVARGIDDPTIAATITELDGAPDGRAAIAVLIDGIRRNYENVFDVIGVMYDAARSEPTVEDAVHRTETYYRSRLAYAARHLDSRQQLRLGLTVADATDRMWLLLGLGSWRVLRELGWTWSKSQDWLTEQVVFAVVEPQPSALTADTHVSK